MTDPRQAAGHFIASSVKAFGEVQWFDAMTAYSDALCDDGLERRAAMAEAYLVLFADSPRHAAALLEFNSHDWERAEMAYRAVYRMPRFKDHDDESRLVVCLQHALVAMTVGFPDSKYLPETSHETC